MKTGTEVITIETDVLVIGGGLAGCMAAIKACESGVKVHIAEKANTASSGCAGSGIDHMWAHIPPIHDQMGYSVEDMLESHTKAIARGFINRELLHLVISESYNRMLNLESFGLKFRYDDSDLPGNFRVVHQFHSVPSAFNFDGRRVKVSLTKEAKKRGTTILNRLNMVDLLTSSDGRVCGAVGVGTRDGKIYSFKAKAVILSTGRVNRLTPSITGVWGNHRVPINETGDGRAMAFRAGLPIINMEFLSPSRYSIGNFELNLGSPRNTVQPAGSVCDADGNPVVPRTQFYDWQGLDKGKVDVSVALENQLKAGAKTHPNYFQMIKDGQGPFYLDLTGGTEEEIRYIEWSISHEGKGMLFLEHLKNQEKFDFQKDKLEWLPNSREMAGTASSGLVVNKDLETEIKGLFAAGDEVGGVPWSASPGAFAMGWRAGEMAASMALTQRSFCESVGDTLKNVSRRYDAIHNNESGQHWREIEMAVQNIVDYYAGNVRTEKMLSRGIERLKDLKAVISYKANSPHELGRCLEVISVIENAEMVLRASLERRESRPIPFGFFRADFPQPDDEYFSFLSQRRSGMQIEFAKQPI
jgi:succinate dehydrogenase/fumarate reductase flavoprotein subunit